MKNNTRNNTLLTLILIFSLSVGYGQSNYKILFSVNVSHSYFDDKIDPSIRFKPSESCLALMSRYGLIIRPTRDGFYFFANTEESIVSFLETIKGSTEATSLDFDIVSDSKFYYYTSEFPLDSVGQLVFSSNDELNQIENENIVLHPNFIEEQGDVKIENSKLKIHFTDLLSLSKNSDFVNFNISFNTRSTYWDYYFIAPSGADWSNVSITSDSNIQFINKGFVMFHNEQKALLFKSEALIPLSEFPKHKFELIFDSRRIKLPIPSIDSIELININGGNFIINKMYFYL